MGVTGHNVLIVCYGSTSSGRGTKMVDEKDAQSSFKRNTLESSKERIRMDIFVYQFCFKTAELRKGANCLNRRVWET